MSNNQVTVIFYIHHNPIHHKLSNHYSDYNWSSYFLSGTPMDDILNYNGIIGLFGNDMTYLTMHEEYLAYRKSFENETVLDIN